GAEVLTRRIALLQAWAGIPRDATFRRGARKGHEASVEARGGPRKTGLRRAFVPARMRAERNLQFDEPYAATVVAIGVGARNARLKLSSMRRRDLAGDALLGKMRTEVQTRFAQVLLGRDYANALGKLAAVGGDGDQCAVANARIGTGRRRRSRARPALERQDQRPHGQIMICRRHAVHVGCSHARTAYVV